MTTPQQPPRQGFSLINIRNKFIRRGLIVVAMLVITPPVLAFVLVKQLTWDVAKAVADNVRDAIEATPEFVSIVKDAWRDRDDQA